MRRCSRKAWLAACAAAVGLVLSGCSSHPGTAAVVNGEKISESQLDELAEQIEANGGEVPQRPTLLAIEVSARWATPVIDESSQLDDSTKEQMVEACISQLGTQYTFFGEADASSLPEPIKVVCYSEYASRIDPQIATALERAQNEVSITTSPRYGDMFQNGRFNVPAYLEVPES